MSLEKKIGLSEGEYIVAVVRSFFFVRFLFIALSAIIFACMAFGTFWFIRQGVVGRVGLGAGLIASVTFFIKGWWYDRVNFLVITNERIIDVVRTGLFRTVVTGVHYHMVQDVIVERRGLGAAIYNYGTISIVTDDELGVVELSKVRFPYRIQKLITLHKERAAEGFRSRSLPDLFGAFLDALPQFSEAQLITVEKRVQDRLHTLEKPVRKTDLR